MSAKCCVLLSSLQMIKTPANVAFFLFRCRINAHNLFQSLCLSLSLSLSGYNRLFHLLLFAKTFCQLRRHFKQWIIVQNVERRVRQINAQTCGNGFKDMKMKNGNEHKKKKKPNLYLWPGDECSLIISTEKKRRQRKNDTTKSKNGWMIRLKPSQPMSIASHLRCEWKVSSFELLCRNNEFGIRTMSSVVYWW